MKASYLLCSTSALFALFLGCSSCSDKGDGSTRAMMAFTPALTQRDHFFDAPYPADARLTTNGTPDLTGYPRLPSAAGTAGLLELASQRHGFPLTPVAYVRFTAPLAPLSHLDIIAAEPTSALILVDIDPNSPQKGMLRPLIAETLGTDIYTPANLLAIAPFPGFLLRENTTYALLITTKVKDAKGASVGAASELGALRSGTDAAATAFAPLWDALPALGLELGDLAAATVFTTGDPFGETKALSDAALANYPVEIDPAGITLDNPPEHENPDLCELVGSITYPQFQTGTPPFGVDGRFAITDGIPQKQRDEVAPIGFAIPKRPMPADGYPLVVTIHGTSGYSNSFVAPIADGDQDAQGRVWGLGTAFPMARVGLASAGSAMPVNKQRVPNAPDTQYVNLANLPVARFNLTQGIIESRFFIRALTNVRIPVAVVAGCMPPEDLVGLTEIKFDPSKMLLTGQSMGGMYTSMVAAVDPAVKAAIPTGAGGYFALQFLINSVTNDPKGLIAALLNTQPELLSQLHPVIAIANAAYEPADPLVFVERIAARPPAGASPKPVLVPTAPDDEYFPPRIYAALGVAYQHQRVGASIMPEVETALALAGRSQASYPLANNVNGVTSATAEFPPPPGLTGHQISLHRADTRYQMACFFKTFIATGTATIVEPKDDASEFACD